MKRAIWLTVQVVWLVLCVVALIEAYRGYRGISDWQFEEGLGFEMVVLSFPASLLVVVAFMLTGMTWSFSVTHFRRPAGRR